MLLNVIKKIKFSYSNQKRFYQISSNLLNDIPIQSDDHQTELTNEEEEEEYPNELWLFNSLAQKEIGKLPLEENTSLLNGTKELTQRKTKDPLKLLESEIMKGIDEGDSFFAGRSKHIIPGEIKESELKESTDTKEDTHDEQVKFQL